MHPPIVSVIVFVPTDCPSLDACLESVLGQTLSDLEVLCVGWDSDVETMERLERWAERDARVRVLGCVLGSAGAAKNVAIRSASGDYIGFVEAGDTLASEMYERLVAFAEAHPQIDVVKCDYEAVAEIDGDRFARSHKLLEGRPKDYEKRLNPRKHAQLFGVERAPWAGIYRRSFLTRYNVRYREAEGPFEEHGFWFSSLALANGVAFLPLSLCRHREGELRSLAARDSFAMCDEYDFAEQRVRYYRGVFEAVERPYLAARYIACSWALRKLQEDLRPALVQRIHEDFARRIAGEDDVDKIFSPTFYRRWNRELRWLLTQPEAYLDDINHQVLEFSERQKAFASWAVRKPTVIVGTGTLGVTAQMMLAHHGVRIAAFVEEDASVGQLINGVPVKVLPQLDCLQGMQFLLAVGKAGAQMKKQLRAAGVAAGDVKSFELRRLSWEEL